MARTIAEIKAQMVSKKEATEELAVFTSDSKTSIWGLMFYIVACAIHIMEQMWTAYKAEQEDFAERQQIHGLRWYRDRTLEFQDGKELIWTDGAFKYPPPSDGEDLAALQIVKQAAVVESPDHLLVKIATEQGGILQPVTAAQQLRVLSYMNLVRDAGNDIEIINVNPDEIKISGTVYCDPLLIASDGSLVSDGAVFPVEDAIAGYINEENFQNFNGELRRTFLKDRIQLAKGVVDVKIDSLKARHGTLGFEEVEVSYLPFSGYYTIALLDFEYIYE